MTWFFSSTPLPTLAISSFLLDHFHQHENKFYPLSLFKRASWASHGPPASQTSPRSSPHLPFLLPYLILNPLKSASVLTTAVSLLVKATTTLHYFIQCPRLTLDVLSPLGNMGHSNCSSLWSTLIYLVSRKSHTPACPPDSLVPFSVS